MRPNFPLALLSVSLCAAPAQVTPTDPGPQPVPPSAGGVNMPGLATWPVTAQDWNTTTQEFSELVTNASTGEVTAHPHQVIQVGNGLNYLDASGAWQPSQDLIELTPNGGAAATHGPHQVYFSPAGLNDAAALTIITASQMALTVRVQGVYLVDNQSGQSRLLATPSDGAIAELRAPNQILYKGAFDSDVFQGDLRYTYTKGGFESDIIITRQPKLAPQDCGFNPATTVLQARHQWQNAPPPQRLQQITVGQGTGTELPDQIIELGELFFPCGRGFLTDGGSSTDTNVPAQITLVRPDGGGADIPVGKEWQSAAGPGGSSLLLESVAWTSIAAKLAQLPQMAMADAPASGTAVAQGSAAEPFPFPSRVICLAAAPAKTPGLVLDWNVIDVYSGGQNMTFAPYVQGAGPNYLIVPSGSGYANLSGTVTFQGGCVVKYQPGATLMLSGSVVCSGAQNNPSILTSEYDNQYGDPINTSNSPAMGDVNLAVDLYYATQGSVTLNCLGILYANTAIECVANCGSGLTTTVANCALYDCYFGVYTIGMNVTLQNSATYRVTTPASTPGGCPGNFTGYFSQGSPPVFTVLPVGQVVEQGNSVTFTAAISPAVCATYQWSGWKGSYGPIWAPIPGATGPSLTVPNVVDGTEVGCYGKSPFGTAGIPQASAAVLGNDAWTAWTTLLNNTNAETPNVWTTMTLTEPPALAWNTSSFIYGKTGFTAISQLNSWDINNPPNGPCVVPVTALTGRHGYTRGHGMGGTATNYWLGFPNPPLMTVWFCYPPTNVVQVNVLADIVRDYGTNYGGDYTVLLFDRDVTANGITPMQVSSPPQGGTVQFATQQHAYGTNVPGTVGLWTPAPLNGPPMTLPFLPVYGVGGDSGSPVMVLTGGGALVFLHGTTTTGPGSPGNSPMQADMDTLSAWALLNPASYKMQWSQQ